MENKCCQLLAFFPRNVWISFFLFVYLWQKKKNAWDSVLKSFHWGHLRIQRYANLNKIRFYFNWNMRNAQVVSITFSRFEYENDCCASFMAFCQLSSRVLATWPRFVVMKIMSAFAFSPVEYIAPLIMNAMHVWKVRYLTKCSHDYNSSIAHLNEMQTVANNYYLRKTMINFMKVFFFQLYHLLLYTVLFYFFISSRLSFVQFIVFITFSGRSIVFLSGMKWNRKEFLTKIGSILTERNCCTLLLEIARGEDSIQTPIDYCDR